MEINQLINIYIDKVIREWLQVIKQNILAKDLTPNTIIFADGQVIVARTEDELQRVAHTLTKAIPMKGKMNMRTKIVIISNTIEQVISLVT
jgi:hypothetical protein